MIELERAGFEWYSGNVSKSLNSAVPHYPTWKRGITSPTSQGCYRDETKYEKDVFPDPRVAHSRSRVSPSYFPPLRDPLPCIWLAHLGILLQPSPAPHPALTTFAAHP